MINNFLLVLLENRNSSSPFVICNCWLTDLQPEMVECKQQNCYIELIKSAKGEKMILADKITEERKKNGWSQEELANQLGVSRQAVSKWESAGAVPDLQRILQMSELFSCSGDNRFCNLCGKYQRKSICDRKF